MLHIFWKHCKRRENAQKHHALLSYISALLFVCYYGSDHDNQLINQLAIKIENLEVKMLKQDEDIKQQDLRISSLEKENMLLR